MFFTHTRGYRIGTCVIGFVCTEKTAKAPAAIGGIYFLRSACIRYRQKSMAGLKTLDEWRVFVRGVSGKIGKSSQNCGCKLRKREETF